MNTPTKIVLLKNGTPRRVCDNYNHAFSELLSIQPHSTFYATRWGGWSYLPLYGEVDVIFTRDVTYFELFGICYFDGVGKVYAKARERGVIYTDYTSFNKPLVIRLERDPAEYAGYVYPVDSYRFLSREENQTPVH